MAIGAEDCQSWVALLRGVVLGKVLVVGGVGDGPSRVVYGQNQGIRLTVNVVGGTTVDDLPGRPVDKESGPGIGASVGDFPEIPSRADRDFSGYFGI